MDVDVLIIGAGLSGICAAGYLRRECADLSFALLEGRDDLGGTWALFRYPGIRSDTDMYTLGFGFHPWRDPDAIADADRILDYLRETAAAHAVDERIRFGVRVERCSWSSSEQRWTVHARRGGVAEVHTCRFLWGCTGYYDYAEGHTPDFVDRDVFEGQVVHPQHWPEGLDVRSRRVVVIGSGATAVTLVPALAEQGAQVVMLQRTPTYIIVRPARDPMTRLIDALLPTRIAPHVVRLKNAIELTLLFQLSRRLPALMKRLYRWQLRSALADLKHLEPHFTPHYDPWAQRPCLSPDGDLFAAFRDRGAAVVTDTIDRFVPEGLRLDSGDVLEADIVVTATGLRIQVLGGIAMEVDGAPVDFAGALMYRGAMLQDVPNFAMSLGYTNTSWTLKCELIARYVTRVLGHMRARGYTRCCPRAQGKPEAVPLIDLESGYIQRAQVIMPKHGRTLPWHNTQNLVVDQWVLRLGPVDDGTLEFA